VRSGTGWSGRLRQLEGSAIVRFQKVHGGGVFPGCLQGVRHGFGDWLFIAGGKGHECRAGAGQVSSQCSGVFRGEDGFRSPRHQFEAVGLVKTVTQMVLEAVVFSGDKGGGDQGGVLDVFDGFREVDTLREDFAGGGGFEIPLGDDGDKAKFRADIRAEVRMSITDAESAIESGNGIVRMAFQVNGQTEHLFRSQGAARQVIQAEEQSEANGNAAAQAPGLRDVSLHGDLERKGGHGSALEKGQGGSGKKRYGGSLCSGTNRDVVVEADRYAEGVKAGTEIRGRGRNLIGDGWHLTRRWRMQPDLSSQRASGSRLKRPTG